MKKEMFSVLMRKITELIIKKERQMKHIVQLNVHAMVIIQLKFVRKLTVWYSILMAHKRKVILLLVNNKKLHIFMNVLKELSKNPDHSLKTTSIKQSMPTAMWYLRIKNYVDKMNKTAHQMNNTRLKNAQKRVMNQSKYQQLKKTQQRTTKMVVKRKETSSQVFAKK